MAMVRAVVNGRASTSAIAGGPGPLRGKVSPQQPEIIEAPIKGL
jgi:hypothetical protein